MTQITITFTKQKFNALKRLLGTVCANDAYFANKQLKSIKVPESAKMVTVEMTKEQYVGLRTALSRPLEKDACDFLDIIFDVGEPQLVALLEAEQKEREGSVAAQTGLQDLKEVKVQDIKAAKAKPRIKVKAGSRKAN